MISISARIAERKNGWNTPTAAQRWMVMGMREKLLKILRVPIFPHELADPTEAVADYLLDNDVVPVVRCKDCKWYNRNEDIMPQSGSCEFHEMVKMDWDFCSRAKMDGDGNG